MPKATLVYYCHIIIDIIYSYCHISAIAIIDVDITDATAASISHFRHNDIDSFISAIATDHRHAFADISIRCRCFRQIFQLIFSTLAGFHYDTH
jgi:hypothetical protein